MLIFIHGGSGAGKSTVGKLLAKEYDGIWIDQDSFYKPKKPIVEYIYEGKIIQEVNWDSLEAIDMKRFNEAIEESRKENPDMPIFVTGFALRLLQMEHDPDVNILLDYGLPDEMAQEKMIESRRKAKGLKGNKDEARVRMVVWPYYQETLSCIGKPNKIPVYDKTSKRIKLDEIMKEIKLLLKERKTPENPHSRRFSLE